MRPMIVRAMIAATLTLLVCVSAARAQDVDPQALELSCKIAALTNAEATGNQVLNLIMPQLTELIVRANPGMETAARDMLETQVMPAMHDMLPEMVELTALIYARHFTVGELTQLTDFYGTPLGQKLIQTQPALITEAGQAGQQWAVKVIQKVLKDLTPEFQKRGLQVPA